MRGPSNVPAENSGATRIHVLSDSLINRIAAGEVIERPASVVKELVENAVDAGASRVEVEVEGGGRALLRISDDGCGMGRDDALLALERHATSKIRTDDDLDAIETLGFRGEALSSIAEISRLELLTGVGSDEVGTRVVLDGGVLKDVADAPNPGGTEVRVRRLFFNTPVRLKFLRSTRTEMAHVVDVVHRIAMAHPHVSFRLDAEGRTLVDVAPAESLRRRAEGIVGRSTAAKLRNMAVEDGSLRAEGLVSEPSLHRSNNSGLYLYVNGRHVKDRTFVGAVLAAYRGVVPRGRYPVVVFFLDLPPDEVDVNVHPTKSEVRFRNGRSIWRFVSDALQSSLRGVDGATWTTPHAKALGHESEPGKARGPDVRPLEEGVLPLASRAMDRAVPPAGSLSGWPGPGGPDPAGSPSDRQVEDPLHVPARGCSGATRLTDELRDRFQRRAQQSGPLPSFESLSVLGQYDRTFLLCESGDELVVIDQHAAHERVLFERFRSSTLPADAPMQRLLVPELLEIGRPRALALCDQQDLLAELGAEVTLFGEDTVALHAVPAGIAASRIRGAVLDLADELVAGSVPATPERLRYDLAALLACHSAVRAHDPLSVEEIRVLLRQLDATDFAYACPHGRPVLVRFPRSEVARWFVRD